jgi:ribosomal protein S18 acetylase RimI-like enzyme
MKLWFRPATPADVPAMCAVIDAAYAPQVRRLYGDSPRGRWQPFNPERLRLYLGREPDGVRVGIWQDRLVTVCVCRRYGSLGWFHSLAVHPDVQGRGFGTQVVHDAETYLTSRGVHSIGLMTWPDAVNNIGFYHKLGFRAVGLSLYVYRPTWGPVVPGRLPTEALQTALLSRLPEAERNQALSAAAAIGDALLPGLDYSSWLQWTVDRQMGDVLLAWHQGRPLALALAYTRPENDWLEGRLLLMAPSMTAEQAALFLEQVRRWAVARRLGHFGFPTDIMQPTAADLFDRLGFRLYGDAMLNLARGPWPTAGVHAVRLGG